MNINLKIDYSYILTEVAYNLICILLLSIFFYFITKDSIVFI